MNTALQSDYLDDMQLHAMLLEALAELVKGDEQLSHDLRAAAQSYGSGMLQHSARAVYQAVPRFTAGNTHCDTLGLSESDLVALALAEIVETEALVPMALRSIQGADYGPWPSMMLLRRLSEVMQLTPEPVTHLARRAFSLGLLEPVGERVPLLEQCFALSLAARSALDLNLGGHAASPLSVGELPAGWTSAASKLSNQLAGKAIALVLRRGEIADRQRYAAAVGAALGLKPMLLSTTPTSGLGAAALWANWLPIENLTASTQPNLSVQLQDLGQLPVPRVILATSMDQVNLSGADIIDLDLPALSATERALLWDDALLGETYPEALPLQRFGPTRISTIGARVRLSEGELAPRLRAAMGAELRIDLAPHAVLVPAEVNKDALAAEPGLCRDIDLLLARCRARYTPRPSNAPARMPGVRALLSGPSGTGKTFACSWLATRLGLPLFKLDLSSVVSKWIGETEENLARVLDQLEAVEAVLLMDEADSLFGSRTNAKDGADRHSNNQTNYLLSRIESFDGIALLTTNGRERIDSAFSRRLDQVIEVPLPAARERRNIWRLNLAADHQLTEGNVNQLATLVDLPGGHIRNIMQTAEVVALSNGRPVQMADAVQGVEQEYRKLRRSAPAGLISK